MVTRGRESSVAAATLPLACLPICILTHSHMLLPFSVAGFASTWGPGVWIVTAEMYPQRTRARMQVGSSVTSLPPRWMTLTTSNLLFNRVSVWPQTGCGISFSPSLHPSSRARLATLTGKRTHLTLYHRPFTQLLIFRASDSSLPAAILSLVRCKVSQAAISCEMSN